MKNAKNIMAFDFGTCSIGVAIGQRITCTAQRLTAFKIYNNLPDWKKIEKLFNEWHPEIIVVGLPLNMDNSEQPISFLARKFAKQLRNRFNVHVTLHDERLSTVEARADLFNKGGFRALKKGIIDSESAAIILKSWLEQLQR